MPRSTDPDSGARSRSRRPRPIRRPAPAGTASRRYGPSSTPAWRPPARPRRPDGAARGRRRPRSRSPLAAYPTLVAYADAAYVDPTLAPLLARALADQITTDNPGVMPPAWVGEIAGILARAAAGDQRDRRHRGRSATPGWSSTGRTSIRRSTSIRVVAKQAAEKTEIDVASRSRS